MTLTFADPGPTRKDFERDRWGNPLVTDPNDPTKKVKCRRASSFASHLEDGFGLGVWKVRTSGLGIALNPHLQAAIAATPATDTRRLDELMEQALQAAGGNRAADLGTALHQFRERLHSGDIALEDVPEPWRADLAAYIACLDAHGMTEVPALNEAKVVNDRWKAAGTFDLALEDSARMRFIADLKTGKSAGKLKELIQLYLYATGSLYDVETGERSPIGVVDTHGYIVHLPAGSGTCSLLRLDFAGADDLADLAVRVKELQRVRSWAVTLEPTAAPTPPSKADMVAQVPTSPDEGGDADPAAFEALRPSYQALPADGLAWLKARTEESAWAGVDFHALHVKTVRRFEIYRGLITIAEMPDCTDLLPEEEQHQNCKTKGDQLARTFVSHIVGSDEWPKFQNVTVGHVVGAMNFSEAERFATLAASFAAGAYISHIDDAHRLVLRPAA